MSQGSFNAKSINPAESPEDQFQNLNESQPKAVYETIREIGDGMHANIYLAQKQLIMQEQVIETKLLCVKVFKPYVDNVSKDCAEEEYKVG